MFNPHPLSSPLKVTSWSRTAGEPDAGATDGTSPRAYISVLSELIHPSDVCEGAADDDAGEGRMDSKCVCVSSLPSGALDPHLAFSPLTMLFLRFHFLRQFRIIGEVAYFFFQLPERPGYLDSWLSWKGRRRSYYDR